MLVNLIKRNKVDISIFRFFKNGLEKFISELIEKKYRY